MGIAVGVSLLAHYLFYQGTKLAGTCICIRF